MWFDKSGCHNILKIGILGLKYPNCRKLMSLSVHNGIWSLPFSAQTIGLTDFCIYYLPYLGLVPSYKRYLDDMGMACKLSWPCPLDWKITSFAKLGVATMILKPHPYPFGSKQLNIRATDDITTITYSYCFPKIFYVKFEILEKMLFMLWNYSFFQIFNFDIKYFWEATTIWQNGCNIICSPGI